MAIQKIYVDHDFNQNQILNARQHPLTTAQRISLGNTLTESAESMLVFDIELNLLYVWTGTYWLKVNQEHYTHTQNTSSNVWVVNHNLGKNPAVSIVDTGGNEVEGDVLYVNLNSLTLTFSAPFSGKAYCN
jgi:hypothetical protein